MIRFMLFAALGLQGCAQRSSNEAPVSGIVVQSPDSRPPGAEQLPDLGDRAVSRAVAPDVPALLPAERFGVAPMPRMLPARVTNPDAAVKVKYTLLPPIPPPTIANVKLGTPRERIPHDLGNGVRAVPAKPALPVSTGITEKSRDVNVPPAMPTLGRPLADRVSLDDPTAELANAAIVNPAMKIPFAPASFLRVVLPDPFEFGEQVKPKVPPAMEPGLMPVPVNPPRPK